jgi:FAD/FMN-containing dehydrogenase/Fe-S oxidoreductase
VRQLFLGIEVPVGEAAPKLTWWGSTVPPENTYDDRARSLARALAQRTRGEIRFERGDRALYATDLSVFRQVPIGVVIPHTIDDVVETVAACREHDVPILARGGGTSLAGQTCNLAVVIDFSKYLNHIVAYEPDHRFAWVEPGVICDQLRHLAWRDDLTWAPDPATHAYNTFGGMIGNNSCGSHSLMGGKTVDNIEELEVLTYDGDRFTVGRAGNDADLDRVVAEGGARGRVYGRLRQLRDRYADDIRQRYPQIPRRVSGYNLDDLLPERGFHVARALVGSEGTLAMVLRARVSLVPRPPHRALLLLGYEGMAEAGDHVPELLELEPTALEGVHESVPRHMTAKGRPLPGAPLLPRGAMTVLLEFGGESEGEATSRAEDARRRVEASGSRPVESRVYGSERDVEMAWKVREAGVGASRIPHKEAGWPCWEDTAVDPRVEGRYLRELQALLGRYGYGWTAFGHFGQGCFHLRVNFDFGSTQGVAKYRRFAEQVSDLVVKYGGSLSGEHGDGQARAEFLPKMFGPTLMDAFREYKHIWDPRGRMNPGKVVDPYAIDTNLRVGPGYRPKAVRTHFRFPDDRGSLALATQRCFGVGKCRELSGASTMCPSFQVLRDEKHTTRGRAHLLFEALREGSPIAASSMRDEYVRESLDLCLACKGCKGDCPESVDIATYKAEFLSHYFAGRLRPRQAYAFALIEWWAQLASLAPDAANLLTQTPGLRHLARKAARVAPDRELPTFAARTFTQWWRHRRAHKATGTEVMLWPDTYNDHFYPAALQAAAEVLEHAGCHVVVPDRFLPTGRPLYDWGMLDLARWQLRRILDALRRPIRAGTPIVVLEPSDASVFRHELRQLFPYDEDAGRLGRQVFTLAEFLGQRPGWTPPRVEGSALVHVHCHHRAVIGEDAYLQMLRDMGFDVHVPDPGCCGMAGPFGFEAGQKHDISVARAEQLLMPAVRQAATGAFIVADGFSCREQIRSLSTRRALHLAEVIRLAQRRPERAHDRPPEAEWRDCAASELVRPTSALRGAGIVGAALAVGVGAAVLATGIAGSSATDGKGRQA